jgi:Holliday junction resolvase RusA-like endonuclease
MTLEFRVYGVAQQMGSKRAFVPKGWTRPVITDSNRNLKSWQTLVAESASHALAQLPTPERELLVDGVRLTVAFYLPRPKSLAKRVTAHTKTPDVDKCIRALSDALTKVVFQDDAQICDLVAMKRYAPPGGIPYVDVRVEPSAGVVPITTDQPLFTERITTWSNV